MEDSMYQASIPVFVRALNNLDHILAKGMEHASENDIDPAVFFGARLAPDMFPLSRQVQVATDFVLRGTARLAGQDPESTADNEQTCSQLRERVAKAIETLQRYSRADIDGSENRRIELRLPIGDMTFQGRDFLHYFVLPNLYFHITTVYNILRHNGVKLGKPDFLGRP